MRGDYWVGAGGEKIHVRQNKGARSSLTPSQGSSGQDRGREAACHEAVVRGCLKKGRERVWAPWHFPLFGTCAWL